MAGEGAQLPRLDGVGVFVTLDGDVQIIEQGSISRVSAPFHALGTGHKAALGAMHAGASAERAVEIAAKVDVYTRLPLTVLRLDAELKQFLRA